jgi:hypothetical protein
MTQHIARPIAQHVTHRSEMFMTQHMTQLIAQHVTSYADAEYHQVDALHKAG